MSPENNHNSPSGSDQSMYTLISNLWVFQGSNWEAATRQDAIESASQPLETEMPNLSILIRVEIAASLILIGISLLIHWTSSLPTVSAPVDSNEVQLQQRLPDNGH